MIAGRRWGEVVFEGVTAHSGGQPMALREDAGMAAAELMVEAEAIARTGAWPESGHLDIR